MLSLACGAMLLSFASSVMLVPYMRAILVSVSPGATACDARSAALRAPSPWRPPGPVRPSQEPRQGARPATELAAPSRSPSGRATAAGTIPGRGHLRTRRCWRVRSTAGLRWAAAVAWSARGSRAAAAGRSRSLRVGYATQMDLSKRVTSELQAAAPKAIAANANARGQNRERDNSRTQDMASHPYATQQFGELTPGR